MTTMKTIGQLAKSLGINVETIRYYQRLGLIAQPEKPANGFRVYPQQIAEQLQFILKAKKLGFTLKEIESLMSLGNDCQQVQTIGLQKLDVIRQKIRELQQLEQVIEQMTDACKTNSNTNNCPIISALIEKQA